MRLLPATTRTGGEGMLASTSAAELGRQADAGTRRSEDWYSRDGSTLYLGRAEDFYQEWERPVCIVVDGPYGVAGFPGDPPTPDALGEWYEPHIAAWSERATPETTLWFWNTELGWATVHPVLKRYGWEYRNCHVWDKGKAHIAGNANSKTLRKFPVVTEVCVQYVKKALFATPEGELSMQEWLRYEWARTGLPFYLANKATDTANAATRKYLTACHLWYYPPVEAFQKLAAYANKHGHPDGRPYFSINGRRPISGRQWGRMRAKFDCTVGISNVWREPPVRGNERLKKKWKCVHNNQKPLRLVEISLAASTDSGDMVWEPFGGLCSVAVAAHRLGRKSVSAEILPDYFSAACERLATYDRPQAT